MKLRRGQMVVVTFLDHVMGRESLVTCQTMGWIERWDDKKIVLKWWRLGDKSLSKENDENYTLVRAAITKITPLSIAE